MNSKSTHPTIYKVEWTSPSNIALVKYWGKFDVQLPQNPSISFTLKNSITTLSIEVSGRENLSEQVSLDFFFEGKINSKFEKKISDFLGTILDRFPWIKSHHLKIESVNTFPHSSGIASSASSMSALCLSLLSVDEFFSQKKMDENIFYETASELSRLASGSASRSIYAPLASWGECSAISGSTNNFASPFMDLHPFFKDYCDSILIVDANEKSVSSRAGHSLMSNHPFRDVRFREARENMNRLVHALKAGDLPTFIEVVEEEALTLHALMMTSRPSYILLRPESLWLIQEIRNFREKENIPACFTIDAGPNIHLLYPKSNASVVRKWIESTLSDKLVGVKWIHDEVGMGPVKQSEFIHDTK